MGGGLVAETQKKQLRSVDLRECVTVLGKADRKKIPYNSVSVGLCWPVASIGGTGIVRIGSDRLWHPRPKWLVLWSLCQITPSLPVLRSMLRVVGVVTLLAKGGQVGQLAGFRPVIVDMRTGENDMRTSHRVWLMVLGETPFAFIASALVSNKAADLLPIRRIAQAILFTDRHSHFPPY